MNSQYNFLMSNGSPCDVMLLTMKNIKHFYQRLLAQNKKFSDEALLHDLDDLCCLMRASVLSRRFVVDHGVLRELINNVSAFQEVISVNQLDLERRQFYLSMLESWLCALRLSVICLVDAFQCPTVSLHEETLRVVSALSDTVSKAVLVISDLDNLEKWRTLMESAALNLKNVQMGVASQRQLYRLGEVLLTMTAIAFITVPLVLPVLSHPVNMVFYAIVAAFSLLAAISLRRSETVLNNTVRDFSKIRDVYGGFFSQKYNLALPHELSNTEFYSPVVMPALGAVSV